MDIEIGYNSYCARCGKKIEAREKAVNMDDAIIQYLGGQSEDEGNLKKLLLIYKTVSPGIYLAPDEMKLNYSTVFSELTGEKTGFSAEIRGEDVLRIIEKKYGVSILKPQEKDNNEEQAPMDTLMAVMDAMNAMENNNKIINKELVRKLFRYMCFSSETILDDTQKREAIEELLENLIANKDNIIFEGEIIFGYQDLNSQNGQTGRVYEHYQIYISGAFIAKSSMVCPGCGKKMHFLEGVLEEYVVVMLGSARVGKTAYLAALETLLNKALLDGISSEPDNEAVEFEKENMALYQACRPVKKTPVTDERDVPTYIRKFTIDNDKFLVKFIDMPGEAWANTDNDFVLSKREICHYASVFWMCVDPVQIVSNVSNYQDVEIENDKIDDSNDKVDENFREVWRNIKVQFQFMFGGSKGIENIPMAIMITKSDLLFQNTDGKKPWFQPSWSIKAAGAKETEFSRKFLKRVNGRLCLKPDPFIEQENYILDIMEQAHGGNGDCITDDMFQDFLKRNYFAISAYGKKALSEAEAEQHPDVPQPSLIELPFLWTLAHFNNRIGFALKEQEQITQRRLFRKKTEITIKYIDKNISNAKIYLSKRSNRK